ncbi:MAG: protoporphyrinogen oxidase [Candidatus Omnitrophota bacterium]|nr:protoporphyrinogen oxidase [Candidatus Omnitrophota bacterium]
MTKKVVIVGGGISGLTAAYRLSELMRERKTAVRIHVLEAAERFGGVIESTPQDGFLLERGPDCFTAEPPHAVNLCKRLGLEKELVGVSPENRRLHLCHNGRLFPFPDGFQLIAPVKASSLLHLPFLSLSAVIRMACEPLIPPRNSPGDESLGALIRRRFGGEVAERIGQPLFGSIFSCDIDTLSVQAAFPRFAEMETKYGSLVAAFRAIAKKHAAKQVKPGERPPSIFYTFADGLQTLVDRLVEKLKESDLRTSAEVESIGRGTSWEVTLKGGERLEADAVCLALPSFCSAKLLTGIAPETAHALKPVARKSMITVNIGFAAGDGPSLPAGSGFIGSPKDKFEILGCTFSSQKFSSRAPEGSSLLRVFIGGTSCEALLSASDTEIGDFALEKLRTVLKIVTGPLFVTVSRYRGVMPHYQLGHLDRVAAIEGSLRESPGLYLAGNSFRGAGIPACIERAEATAVSMAEFITFFEMSLKGV